MIRAIQILIAAAAACSLVSFITQYNAVESISRRTSNVISVREHHTTHRTLKLWAQGSSANIHLQQHVPAQILGSSAIGQLKDLCGRCIYHTLFNSITVHGTGSAEVFVATGDIPDEWIRDGSVQLATYLPKISKHPAFRQVIEGAIRTQSWYILQDPWANAFSSTYRKLDQVSHFERHIGRGGWVATRNFELDSGAYFMSLLWAYYSTAGLYRPDLLLREPLVHDAVALMIRTWQIEQRHEELSPYRYAELARDGLGPPTAFTGMIWSGFRPSDDPQTYSYNIPCNMYAAGSLSKMLLLNEAVWHDEEAIAAPARKLISDIRSGIKKHGIVKLPDAQTTIYAYEVDGLGGVLKDFDDPNVPSLISIPLLGYTFFEEGVYWSTRRRILSPVNKYYYKGPFAQGCGSPHTPPGYIWPLGLMVQGLTSNNATEKADLLLQLLKMQGDNGLMHESVNVNNLAQYTRPVFEWANALLVTFVEDALGADCDDEAQRLLLKEIREREGVNCNSTGRLGGDRPGGSDAGCELFFERIEQKIHYYLQDAVERSGLVNPMTGPRLVNPMTGPRLVNPMTGPRLVNPMTGPRLVNAAGNVDINKSSY